MTIYLTHGAKKNVGDYLIHARGRSLFKRLLPDEEVISVPRWARESLIPKDARLVMCGGPGISSRMVEDTFPLVDKAVSQGIEVSGIALGWSGQPPLEPGSFQMTARSLEVLHANSSAERPLGVRDNLTLKIAQQLGIKTVLSGCTAWYSLPDLGKEVSISSQPSKVIFTTPASPKNTNEAIKLMRLLKMRYPRSELFAVFHRGILPDRQTDLGRSAALIMQSAVAKSLGYKIVDASYNLDKINFYRNSDLHIGYRVHAHLAFVSQHRPSVLICEDGRGHGQAVTLNPELEPLWAGDKNIVELVDETLRAQQGKSWPALTSAINKIEETYPTMVSLIESLALK